MWRWYCFYVLRIGVVNISKFTPGPGEGKNTKKTQKQKQKKPTNNQNVTESRILILGLLPFIFHYLMKQTVLLQAFTIFLFSFIIAPNAKNVPNSYTAIWQLLDSPPFHGWKRGICHTFGLQWCVPNIIEWF